MNLSQIFQSVLAIVKADAAKTILPALAAFFTSVAANPSALNFAAALAKLNVDVLAALPGIEQDALTTIAGILNQEVQALATSAAPPAAAAPAKA